MSEERGEFVLRSQDFDSLTDARAVRERALDVIAVLNGLARLAMPRFQPVAIDQTIYSDGGTFVTVGPAIERLPVVPTHPDNSTLHLDVATRQPQVAQALRFFGLPPTSETLWKVYEIIRDDAGGGADHLVNNGWVTKDQIDGFRAVHYPSVFGQAARHGVEPSRRVAPRHPMSLAQAREFIGGLREQWLASK